jgi:trk system potassium uptake protein TrkA
MNIVVVGYGRVGSSAIKELKVAGHEITLIEQREDRIERAGRVEGLKIVRGNAIDLDVQSKAGVDRAQVFLALTREDTVNLVAAQVAKLRFSVPHAIARIYVPSRAPIFEKRGIQTICPTLYTVEAIGAEIGKIAGQPPPSSSKPQETRQRATRISERPLDETRFVLISGGGKIGAGLARTLLSRGVEVAIIEKDALQAARVASQLDVPVFVGDGSARGILEEAGASRAKVLAAVTGSDEDNLVACETAKEVFGVEKTIARVSNPKNEDTMRALGVDTTVATTAIISSFIERELPGLQIRTLLSLQAGDVQLIELQVPEGSPAAGRTIRDIPIPPETNIIAVLRKHETIVSRGDTEIRGGDTVLILVKRAHESEMRRAVLGKA